MTNRLQQWLTAGALAACLGLTQPGAAGAGTTTFLDPGAWTSAASRFGGFTVQPMPAVSPERITMSDGFGSWTLAEQATATVTLPHPDYGTPLPPRSRDVAPRQILAGQGPTIGAWATSGLGELSASFGCNGAFFPCYGMHTVEFVFQTPIRGFAGNLIYGEGQYGGGFVSYLSGISASPDFYVAGEAGFRFSGFYGVIFPEPTRVLRFAWYPNPQLEGTDHDGAGAFQLFDARVIGVPEPGLAVSFAVSLLLVMLLAGRGAGAAAASFALRRVRPRR